MKILKLKQGSPEWKAQRKEHIGASDISAISGNNPWKNSYNLWEEKTGRKDSDISTEAMRHGSETESIARSIYVEDRGTSLDTPTCESDEWPIARASLDGITEDLSIIVEIKCPTKHDLYDKALKGNIPDYYLDQIQWQLWVTGAERCDFMVFIDQFNYKVIPVMPDTKYQKNLVTLAKNFWAYVISDTPPPIKDPAIFINDNFSNELALELKKWDAIEKDAHERTEYLKNQLKDLHNTDKRYLFPSAGVKLIWAEIKGKINWDSYQSIFNISDEVLEEFKIIDWKAYQAKCNISDDELKEYRKESSKYGTFSMID
jgi:putative phage-type endonuclease